MRGKTVPSGEDMEEDVIRRLDRERMSREIRLQRIRCPETTRCCPSQVCQNGLTLEKTGHALGVNRERVRQSSAKKGAADAWVSPEV